MCYSPHARAPSSESRYTVEGIDGVMLRCLVVVLLPDIYADGLLRGTLHVVKHAVRVVLLLLLCCDYRGERMRRRWCVARYFCQSFIK